ncbi:glutathione S-transferase family protein [Chroococcidiopsis sp. CCNUC1]|uniref:glutathione S-transferase family protein n=1 Tax=Chroococcidiopsis sp. CCNUC1 TaxID=2653189 RepID=UPI0020224354|nr:glutathione S-transferase family protein [Chroococcidiopsis sp. CCNUC1]URD49236.1 glutathione S-transferase family protein [Chroococcidiopsis sp. CCNUC1]
MTQFTLVIGNKNYSSWSLRPWLVLKQIGVDFNEIRIPLDTLQFRQEIFRYSPTGKVPVLQHGDITIWESLAICEYLIEQFPAAKLLPTQLAARALARSISAEMHAGFQNLRQNMPMNCRSHFPGKGMKPGVQEDGVQEDIDRITTIWRECREKFGNNNGDLLFGHFTIADAMFAPVVSRFITYGVKLDPICQDYAEVIRHLPAMQAWITAAQVEPEHLEQYDNL